MKTFADLTDAELLKNCVGWHYQEAKARGLLDFDNMPQGRLRDVVERDRRYGLYEKLRAARRGEARGLWEVEHRGRNLETGRSFPVPEGWKPQHRALIHDAPRLITKGGS